MDISNVCNVFQLIRDIIFFGKNVKILLAYFEIFDKRIGRKKKQKTEV